MVYNPRLYQRMERRYSDAQAVLAIARKNPEWNAAYSEVYQRYYDPLVLHASGILKDREEAEDIVSDVLGERFYTNCTKLVESAVTGELNLQAWFYRVTRNLCFNIVRDRKRRNAILTTAQNQHEGGVLFSSL